MVVSPEDDIEVRRSRIWNRSKIRRTIEFTSYAEVVLASPGEDQAQPAFSNLFVETEWLPEHLALLATRRSDNASQGLAWMSHMLKIYGDAAHTLSYETNRTKFVGRGAQQGTNSDANAW